MKIFIGFDPRQPLAYTVCRSSIERHAASRVQIEPIKLAWMPITRRGLTDFTYARFLVPWLCDYQGYALFMDSDIIVRGDVNELLSLANPLTAINLVKNKQQYEWPSVMLFRCDSSSAKNLTPKYIDNPKNSLFDFEWVDPTEGIGDLPSEWNYLVGYDDPNPDAKLLHYTAGIPCWPETQKGPFVNLWQEELRNAISTVSWDTLMGRSVHKELVAHWQ